MSLTEFNLPDEHVQLQLLASPWPDLNDVETTLVRLDLLHPNYGGNKWFKLKYNLQRARDEGHNTLITFGGAFSNHIRATAAAAQDFGFKLVCVIRGERTLPLNPVLTYVERLGGRLHFFSREAYRHKSDKDLIQQLHDLYGPAYVIPEGGANAEGVLGSMEILKLLPNRFDTVACACGTFTTLSGLALAAPRHVDVVGISVLKAAGYGISQLRQLTNLTQQRFPHIKPIVCNVKVNDDYHFGGYAKSTHQLEQFRINMKATHDVDTDFVYTAKLIFAVHDMIIHRRFKPGSRIAVLMSGPSEQLSTTA